MEYRTLGRTGLKVSALGLGTCLTTLYLRREGEVKAFLGIPAHVDTYALIPLGYPARQFGPLGRQPVGEVSFVDRWGELPAGSAAGVETETR